MKELSIEEKAKRYDLAIEAAKSIYNNMEESGNFGGIEDLEVIFPELAESEDERMFKAIAEGIRDEAEVFGWSDFGDIPIDDILAWLEKQREKTSDKIVEKARTEKQRVLLTETDGNANIDWDCRSINDVKILLKCGLEFIRNIEANKQILTDNRFGECSFRVPTWYNEGINQGEQKSTDKVEPKFKVGDWVVLFAKNVYQVEKIENYEYTLRHILGGSLRISFSNDDLIKLWSIQDAKPGDVLVCGEQLFLFKRMNTSNSFYSHCSYHFIGYDSLSVYDCSYSIDNIYPATKEQRDLLFQKMKEAGYRWKNNQLEKIDNEDFVDLGLPSGTLWAKCNLGGEKETDFGLYYQWGDTQGYFGVDEYQFNWDDYKWGTPSSLTKYNSTDGKLDLGNEDDPVYAATGRQASMPTIAQLQELKDHTNYEWTTIDGINGMKFINKNDDTKYIFIPAVGYCYDGCRGNVGSWGVVWSASRNESKANNVWSMGFDAYGIYMGSFCNRCYGFSVRGVLNK